VKISEVKISEVRISEVRISEVTISDVTISEVTIFDALHLSDLLSTSLYFFFRASENGLLTDLLLAPSNTVYVVYVTVPPRSCTPPIS